MNLNADHTPQKMLNSEGWTHLTSGHPWVRARHFKQPPPLPSPGAWHWGEHWFLYSPSSQIPLRRLGPSLRHWNFAEDERRSAALFLADDNDFRRVFGNWLVDHLEQRLKFKQSLDPQEKCFRWIFSESDLIPGLIVDRFDGSLVCQIQSAPIEKFWNTIEAALGTAYRKTYELRPQILARRNASVRLKEGLAIEESTATTERQWIDWNGLRWFMNPGGAQKTGSYLDQKNNHARAAHWAQVFRCRRAWDLCCFEGGFGLHLAKRGIEVLAVDQSAGALEVTRSNAQANGCSDSLKTEKADIFEWLRGQNEAMDFIALDPPSFVKDFKSKGGAMKGFKELNLRAMKNLRSGGLLVTCSCSHHVSREDFERMLRSAAHDCRREFSVLETGGPAPDHAPLVNFPEGNYLQAWYLRML